MFLEKINTAFNCIIKGTKCEPTLLILVVQNTLIHNPGHNILELFNNLAQVRIAISKTILDI